MGDRVNVDREAIAQLCREFGVQRLSVFGSALTDDLDPERSDVDILVEYRPDVTSLESYFGLKARLEDVFGRPVDLVMRDALRNPYLIETIERTKRDVYAA